MDREIKLSFWNYVKSGILGREAVRDWKELGFNLAMSFEFDAKINPKSEMLEILDECQIQGIKLIICDSRTHYRTYAEKGEAEYRKGALEAYEDFGKHPATFGFFVGDEPRGDMQYAIIGAYKVVLEIAPELTPYGNLYPFWTGSDYTKLMGGNSREFYFDIVDKMLRESKAPVVSYDRYTQCLQEGENIDGGLDMYFADLDMFHRVSKKNGIPFYTCLLSVGHWVHRVPTEDDIRWQLYTALAHGARGIFWFFLYMRGIEDDYRNSPYETDFRKTEMYDILARQHYIFRANFKEQFDKMYMTDVFHVFHIYEGAKRFYSDDTVMGLSAIRGNSTYSAFYCKYYKQGANFCTRKRIKVSIISDAIIVALNQYLKFYVNFKDIMKASEEGQTKSCPKSSKIELENQLNELKEEKKDLYFQYKNECLTDKEYSAQRQAVDSKIVETQKAIDKIVSKQQESLEISENGFVSLFRKYKKFTKINSEILASFVKRITVYSSRNIEIEWKFKDELIELVNLAMEKGIELFFNEQDSFEIPPKGSYRNVF